MTDDADRANFGGNARENSTGVDSGQQLYQDHGPVSPVLLKSLTISDVACNGT